MRKILLSLAVLLIFSFVVIAGSAVNRQTDIKPQPADIDSPIPSQHLPVIRINSKEQIQKDTTVWADFQVFESSAEDSVPVFTSTGIIKYRGQSSYSTFDKKSYRIEFYKDNRIDEREYALLGLGADSEWVLQGPFLDRSLLRNRLMFTLSDELLPWSPKTEYTELYVNDEYMGLYLLVEPINIGLYRLSFPEFSLLSGETAYIVGRERIGMAENEFRSYGYYAGKTSYLLHIDYPKSHKITHRQMTYIHNDINAFEEALYSDFFADPSVGYAKYINVYSFVDYFLLNEFSMIRDATRLSTFAYKNIGEKLTMTVWDFNNGFDNYAWFETPPDRGFVLTDGNWIDRLLQDRAFTQRVVERYRELRSSLWETARIMDMLDNEISRLGDAIDRNFLVWGYTFSESMLDRDSNGESRDPSSYEEAVFMLKDTITRRLEFMDNNIETLFELCIN